MRKENYFLILFKYSYTIYFAFNNHLLKRRIVFKIKISILYMFIGFILLLIVYNTYIYINILDLQDDFIQSTVCYKKDLQNVSTNSNNNKLFVNFLYKESDVYFPSFFKKNDFSETSFILNCWVNTNNGMNSPVMVTQIDYPFLFEHCLQLTEIKRLHEENLQLLINNN